MGERVEQNIQNPIIQQQTIIAEASLKKTENERAEQRTDEFHDELLREREDEEVINGGGLTKEARLAQIVSGKKLA